ncbi:hypothetical protein H0H92_011250 [Tricholoma furcatifolium]|nr:hypothetical protein H0H92_011250 [Tricholoma furcatifolium]
MSFLTFFNLYHTITSIILSFAAGAVAIYFLSPIVLRKLITGPNGTVLPPGPPNRYAFLRKYPERALHAWAQVYGPLFSVWMGNQLFVVVSDPKIARDLLVTNGSIFSSRKQYFMKNQTILRGRAITASEYGDTWRHHRRIATQVLTPKAMQGYTDIMDYEAHMFIRSLYDESKQGALPINPAHYTGSNMLIIAFATRTDSSIDPLTEKALALAMEFMDLTGPWSNAIDFFEPLQWIPSRMRTRGRNLHAGFLDAYGGLIDRVKSRINAGEHVPDCLVKTLIETQEAEKLDWEDVCMLAAVFVLGGVHSVRKVFFRETLHSTLNPILLQVSGIIQWFLALMPSIPEVQARAHEELDRVIGRDRWPDIEDEENLPYIRAIIKEVQRVHTPFWMATPHCSTEDFEYNGTFIPKGSVVVLNCYTLHHNEERYPDAHVFNPERYMGDHYSCAESAKLPNVMERDHWAFGAGRRICPGLPAAERELWLAFSRLLWAFKFESLPDEPISLEEYEGRSGRMPMPFRLKLTPRVENLDAFLRIKEEITMKW